MTTTHRGEAPAGLRPDASDLEAQVRSLADRYGAGAGSTDADLAADTALFAARFLGALEAGHIRAAEPDSSTV